MFQFDTVVLDIFTKVTGLPLLLVAENVNTTLGEFVAAAPLLIRTDPSTKGKDADALASGELKLMLNKKTISMATNFFIDLSSRKLIHKI